MAKSKTKIAHFKKIPGKGYAKQPDKAFTERLGKGLPRNAEGQWSSRESTTGYAHEFNRLNHFSQSTTF